MGDHMSDLERRVDVPAPSAPRARFGRSPRRLALVLVAAATVMAWGWTVDAVAVGCSGVAVGPSSDLQRAIDRHGAETTFCLADGTYPLSGPLFPKARDRFLAAHARKAVLTGNDRATMAFNGQGVNRVVLRGLVITHFAPPDQAGAAAVKASSGWRIVNNEISYNANAGLYHEARSVILRNDITHNAKIGLGGYRADGSRIQGNVVSFNGSAGGPDNGGSKWTQTVGLTISGNYFHHNDNNGLWIDGDNTDVTITGNRVSANASEGIQYEVSCAGTVTHNRVRRNGGAGIEVTASQHVRVAANRVTGNAMGIVVWHQDRGSGRNCPWTLTDVRIRRNVVAMSRGYTGLQVYNASDGDAIFRPSDGRVRFSSNTYYLSGREKYFAWGGGLCTARQWRAYGQDVDGVFRFR
jgi:hypothetical protein